MPVRGSQTVTDQNPEGNLTNPWRKYGRVISPRRRARGASSITCDSAAMRNPSHHPVLQPPRTQEQNPVLIGETECGPKPRSGGVGPTHRSTVMFALGSLGRTRPRLISSTMVPPELPREIRGEFL